MKSVKKGDFVVYSNGCGFIRALVKTAHRDGRVTVEPYFFLDKDDKDLPGFIGGKYALNPCDFRPL